MWRTEDGARWEAIPLELGDLKVKLWLDLDVTITAGPRGVLVVGNYNNGVYVWHSADGRSFGAMVRVPKPANELPFRAEASATPNGFLLGMNDNSGTMLLSSEDGVHWQNISAGLPKINGIDHVSGNASTLVLFTYYPQPDQPHGKPRAWHRRDGTWQPATIDPGRLPDAGVVPADELRVNAVHNWGTGYIAVGNTFGGDGRETAGLVWYSADGSAWTRMPVRDNGFDTASELNDVAVSQEKAVLVGYPSDSSAKLLTWQAKAPSLPNR
ncbi:hypothetical protein ACFVYA_13475 [Amycolatopsis sp. NPDC058278]|uniref:hypothetical protein n=1 Tax=Amycolatopsis sp. NPDC058278 TaxID=3346417 RepID=UPI0036DB5AE5